MTRLINKKPEELTPEELEQYKRIGRFRKPQARWELWRTLRSLDPQS